MERIKTPNIQVPEHVRKKTTESGLSIARWAGRSVSRTFSVQPILDSHDFSEATHKNWWRKERNMTLAAISGFAFPFTTGIKQSAVSEVPVIGGVAQVISTGMDLAAAHLGIGLPVIGWVGWPVYRALTSLTTEAFPRRKAVRQLQEQRRTGAAK